MQVSCWSEVYEHAEFGEITVSWLGVASDRTHLIAIQSELWTPAEEVEDCVRWVRNLQDDYMTRDGDGDAAAFQ